MYSKAPEDKIENCRALVKEAPQIEKKLARFNAVMLVFGVMSATAALYLHFQDTQFSPIGVFMGFLSSGTGIVLILVFSLGWYPTWTRYRERFQEMVTLYVHYLHPGKTEKAEELLELFSSTSHRLPVINSTMEQIEEKYQSNTLDDELRNELARIRGLMLGGNDG